MVIMIVGIQCHCRGSHFIVGTNHNYVHRLMIIIVIIFCYTLGLLPAVSFLSLTEQDSTISLTWTAPFTLDILDVHPDITYCVDVYKSKTSFPVFHSECGIPNTNFSYPTPPDSVCYIYIFTVTPVNGVGKGTRKTKHFIRLDKCKINIPIGNNIIFYNYIAPEMSEISRLGRNSYMITMV